MITVEVSALVHPTEDRFKVQSAIEKVFPGLYFQFQEKDTMASQLVGRGDKHTLVMLHEQLRRRKILDTARSNMHIEKKIITFLLNKQAAAMGKVNFPPEDEPLGSIWVEITAQDSEQAHTVVDWLAPPTKDGHPLFNIEL